MELNTVLARPGMFDPFPFPESHLRFFTPKLNNFLDTFSLHSYP